MPNKRYLSGYRKELKVKKSFEDAGFICVRSAGSHGIWDLCCVNPWTRKILFVQCKPKKFSAKSKEKLMHEYKWMEILVL
jgi:Holliday junction resolvase